MPIDKAQIPAMVKRVTDQKVPEWKKQYFANTAKKLQVHTKGHLFDKVDTLFPNESDDSKNHCLQSYEPITKGSIWKGINNIKRIFLHSSFSYTAGNDLIEWLEKFKWKGQTLTHYFVELWISRAVAEDPNGMFVVYPPDWAEERNICPVQFVRSELFKADPQSDFFAFVSEQDSKIKYDYKTYTVGRQQFYDHSIKQLNAKACARYTYNQVLELKVVKEVVHVFTPDGILIYQKEGSDIKWETIDFAEPMALPAFPGGGMVADDADQPLYESYVMPFVPFGNLALLQHRNHRAVDLQFSYPRMSEIEIPCDYEGCSAGRVACATTAEYPQGHRPCPQCNGTNYITPQSVYRHYKVRYDSSDPNNEHLKHDPVRFFSPDAGIITYSKDAWKDYLKMAETAIFVQQQVYTGQVESAESKDKNFEDMYAWLTGPVKTFYQGNLRPMLQALENYSSTSPSEVTVEQPFSLAILTEAEAFEGLTKIMGSQAPHFIKANRVEGFISKFVSKDAPLQKAIKLLKKYDPLLFYTSGEIQGLRSGNAIKPELVARHALAYPLMMKFAEEDPTFFEKSDQEIFKMLDAELAGLTPEQDNEDMKQKLLAEFTRAGGAAA